ncbi:MAG: hypothetical protein HOV68_01585 [Streptomycetaceae bacterium]|nr:hypothetical protein [Streptomycetaceae bacterium]
MTGQIPDFVHHRGTQYALTAVAGSGLFDPADHGLRTRPPSTGCWRGFLCDYTVTDRHLRLTRLELTPAEPPDDDGPVLFGVRPTVDGPDGHHPGSRNYRDMAVPMAFTGRVLLGGEIAAGPYLHMGFRPAWLFEDVVELVFAEGRLTEEYDRSAELADVRRRVGDAGARPAEGEATRDWIERTGSLSYAYSWPTLGG